jgi:hypothetical protein
MNELYREIRAASTTPACTVGEQFIEEQLNSNRSFAANVTTQNL